MRMIFGLLLSFWVCGAAHAGDGNLSAPDGMVLRLAPGESGVLRLRVQGDAALTGGLSFMHLGEPGYQYTASAAAAGCPALEPMGGSRTVDFDPTQGAGDLLCEYTITRSATSIDDLVVYLQLNGPVANHPRVEYHLGVAPALVLSTRQESAQLLVDGRARGLVRIFLASDSSRAIDYLNAGSCLFPAAPFSFNGAIVGGCGDMTLYGGVCFTGGGYGFVQAPFPAQAATSCLVELTTYAPYAGPESFPIYIANDYFEDVETGGLIWPVQPTSPRNLVLSLDLVFADGLD